MTTVEGGRTVTRDQENVRTGRHRMTVLVTGANGFIGSNLCRALAAAGHEVVGLVRASSDLTFLTDLDAVSLVTGDVTAPATLKPAMAGVALVYHTAGYVADWGAWEAFRAGNIDGVRNVLESARAAGVRRLVHLSSASVYGFPGRTEITEDHPFVPCPGDRYVASKREGEQIAQSYHGRGLEVTTIRPATVYGPNDRTTTLKLAAALVAGTFGYVDGGRHYMAPVYIDNLVELMLRAGTAAAAGEAFNAVDDGLTRWREFTEWLCADLGCPCPRLSLPRRVAWPLAVAIETAARALGRKASPPITTYRIRAVMSDNHYSAAKAKRLLGYRPAVSTREGVRRTVAWYRGYCGAGAAA